ncbi:unnamed protein product [Lactuca saligna]|uniref:Uncharacterized protein n=1 Tax=Lactuca saligna TaxID=75948 RepID=A0AA35ULT4_LACSI|nr:unnamed protein product [Lactuca saligna]
MIGLLPHEKLKVEFELSDSEGSLEPTIPLSLSERDEEDKDVESKVETEEDLNEEPEEDPYEEAEEDLEEEPEGNHMEYHVEQRYEMFHMPYVEYTPTSSGNQIRVKAAEKSKPKIRRLEQEVLDLRKPTITKLLEGFVAQANQAKTATYIFLNRVVGRDPPQAEVVVIQSGSGDRKAKKIRKYLKGRKRILKYDDIVFKK